MTHQDGSVVLAGHQNLDFYVTKLDAEGTLEWSFEVKLPSVWGCITEAFSTVARVILGSSHTMVGSGI